MYCAPISSKSYPLLGKTVSSWLGYSGILWCSGFCKNFICIRDVQDCGNVVKTFRMQERNMISSQKLLKLWAKTVLGKILRT